MSGFEDIHYTPSEEEPAMLLEAADGQELIATRMNTRLHTFLGRTAFNHIFILKEIEEETNRQIGYFIWSHNNNYGDMEEYMMENDYPAVLNALTVPASDIEVYHRSITEDQDDTETDFIPDGWQ